MSKKVYSKDLRELNPIGDHQKDVFASWESGQNQFLYGAAGTGKTFVLLYNAMYDILDSSTPYERVILVRSLIPTREIGFLPGDEEDKSALYQVPYMNMIDFMFHNPRGPNSSASMFELLKEQKMIYFMSTSFLRGLTFDNTIVIVDECQNLNFHELDTIITRSGQNTRISFAGDFGQSDLVRTNEKNGLYDFLRILENMPSFNITEFDIADIVRSGLVKEYLIEKTKLGLGSEL